MSVAPTAPAAWTASGTDCLELVRMDSGADDVLAPAFRACGLTQVPVFVFPFRTAFCAGEEERRDEVVPTLNPESFSFNESGRDLVPRDRQDPLEGALRNPHSLSALFLVETD
jgi:hypothetical protein